jgi:hypothetical protein
MTVRRKRYLLSHNPRVALQKHERKTERIIIPVKMSGMMKPVNHGRFVSKHKRAIIEI